MIQHFLHTLVEIEQITQRKQTRREENTQEDTKQNTEKVENVQKDPRQDSQTEDKSSHTALLTGM